MGHELSGTIETAPEGSALSPGQNVYIVPLPELRALRGLPQGHPPMPARPFACSASIATVAWPRSCAFRNAMSSPVGDTSLDDAAMIEFLAIGAAWG